MTNPVIIGNAELWHGDCLEILPTLPKVDSVITDPPYGLGDKWQGGREKWPLHHGQMKWDATTVNGVVNLPTTAPIVIIWGGHLYALPPARGWLIWDKKQNDRFTSGQAELAWSSIDQPIRTFRMSQVEAYCGAEGKDHPTQKPSGLMRWCVAQAGNPNTVLDPYMGAGSTGVACMQLGRKFIGIEIERKYFDIACERIENAQRQVRMFV